MVKCVAMPVRRQDLSILVEIPASVRDLDRHPSGEREIRLTAEQTLGGQVGRDQRSRTRGLNVYARTGEVEQVTDASGEEVFVVSGMAKQKHAHRIGPDLGWSRG